MNRDHCYTNERGVRIAYWCYGRSDEARAGDLVFFNGLYAGRSVWAVQYRNKALLKNFRLVFFDYRCQGESSQVTHPFGMTDIIDDIRGLLAALDLKRPCLIGHSYGGILAGLIAGNATRLAGDRVPVGVVLVNSATEVPYATTLLLRQVARLFDEIPTQDLTTEAVDEYCTPIGNIFRILKPLYFGERFLRLMDGFDAEMVRRYTDYNRCPRSIVRLMEAILNRPEGLPAARESMRQIACPVLVITGDDDKIIPAQHSKKVLEVVRDAHLHVFTGCGHTSMLEERAAFDDELERFVYARYFGNST